MITISFSSLASLSLSENILLNLQSCYESLWNFEKNLKWAHRELSWNAGSNVLEGIKYIKKINIDFLLRCMNPFT